MVVEWMLCTGMCLGCWVVEEWSGVDVVHRNGVVGSRSRKSRNRCTGKLLNQAMHFVVFNIIKHWSNFYGPHNIKTHRRLTSRYKIMFTNQFWVILSTIVEVSNCINTVGGGVPL